MGKKMIQYFLLCILLTGCTAKGEDDFSLLPREYYRSIISVDEIGAAFSKRQEAVELLVPIIIKHESISDAVLITHEGETIVGLRLKPYYRHGSGDVIEEISLLTAIEVANIIDDPRKYRILERLSKEKKLGVVSDMWVQEWSNLRQ